MWLRYRSRLELHHRAAWLQLSCARILRRLGISADVSGPRPAQGLIVANHLSYLDILAFASAMPCLFVAKREVSRWPGIGFLARCGGTIFIDRRNRSATEAVAGQIAAVLRAGVPVLLFPEGTSTDGSEVLRFHPSLLGAAVEAQVLVIPAAIAWRPRGGEERDLCYYGKIRFVPHLLATLGRRGISCAVEFDPKSSSCQDRKVAAAELREKVVALRTRMTRGMQG